MSEGTLRLLVGAVLLVHGIAHIGAVGALLWLRAGHETRPGSWTAARSWLAPGLARGTASQVAMAFYAIALVGFVLTALAWWGAVLPVEWWRPLGVVAAVVSTAGIISFLGSWPLFNTLAALAVNVAVLLAVITQWPPESVFRP